MGACVASGCGAISAATKSGMKPILVNGIDGFVQEPDAVLAEQALAGNLKLIEGVVATYPDDRELLQMAAMARGNYAFAFVQDDLEACRIALPGDRAQHDRLLARVMASYRLGRAYAERALRQNEAFAAKVGSGPLDELSKDRFADALTTLDAEDAPALFWLAFNWGGAVQAALDPGSATQLPKLELMSQRVLALDPTVFYGVGPHLMAGVLNGFRSPALGGRPDVAARHFDEALRQGDLALPEVLKAQWVHAQTEQAEAFKKTLRAVIDKPIRPERALLEVIAKKKACRLLANLDAYFLEDAEPVPPRCQALPHKYPLRAEPLEPASPLDDPTTAPNVGSSAS